MNMRRRGVCHRRFIDNGFVAPQRIVSRITAGRRAYRIDKPDAHDRVGATLRSEVNGLPSAGVNVTWQRKNPGCCPVTTTRVGRSPKACCPASRPAALPVTDFSTDLYRLTVANDSVLPGDGVVHLAPGGAYHRGELSRTTGERRSVPRPDSERNSHDNSDSSIGRRG